MESEKFYKDSLIWMIRTMQQHVDASIWLGAHKKALTQFNGDQTKAVRAADGAVRRSQGSGIFTDRSAFERGNLGQKQQEILRGFTLFFNYFNTKVNVFIEKTKTTKFKNPIQSLVLVRSFIMMFTVEAMVVAYVRGELPADDNDKTWLGTIATETFFTTLAGFPIIRELAVEFQGFRGGGPVSGLFGQGAQQAAQLSSLGAQGQFGAGNSVAQLLSGSQNRIGGARSQAGRDIAGQISNVSGGLSSLANQQGQSLSDILGAAGINIANLNTGAGGAAGQTNAELASLLANIQTGQGNNLGSLALAGGQTGAQAALASGQNQQNLLAGLLSATQASGALNP